MPYRRRDPPQAYLPGFEPARRAPRSYPTPIPLPSLDDPRTLTAIEELVADTARLIDYLRSPDRFGTPITLDDIIICRMFTKRRLHAMGLPFPDDGSLDELLIEFVGWFYEFPLAADVPKPLIDVMLEDDDP
jgi:hypothetical protein